MKAPREGVFNKELTTSTKADDPIIFNLGHDVIELRIKADGANTHDILVNFDRTNNWYPIAAGGELPIQPQGTITEFRAKSAGVSQKFYVVYVA